MLCYIKKQGFTLIELMVVIVIIGVLASLAIPRFTEASAKAKVAEAPRVLASYESAYLAAVTELPPASALTLTADDLVFETPQDSKWFNYNASVAKECVASAKGKIGAFASGGYLKTTYTASSGGAFEHTTDQATPARKMVPNFINN